MFDKDLPETLHEKQMAVLESAETMLTITTNTASVALHSLKMTDNTSSNDWASRGVDFTLGKETRSV